jgi:hypothetical protein
MPDTLTQDLAFPGFTQRHSVDAVTRILTNDLVSAVRYPNKEVKVLHIASRLARRLHPVRMEGQSYYEHWQINYQRPYLTLTRKQVNRTKRSLANLQKIVDGMTAVDSYYRECLTGNIEHARNSVPTGPRYDGKVTWLSPQPLYAALSLQYWQHNLNLGDKPGDKQFYCDYQYRQHKGKMNSGEMTREEFRSIIKSHTWYGGYHFRDLENKVRMSRLPRALPFVHRASLNADVPF